jgi:hypothetical protein
VTFHALRHTCGCHLAQGSWAPEFVSRPFTLIEIKEWLGHSSVEVTERHYVDFMPDNLHSAVHGPKRKSEAAVVGDTGRERSGAGDAAASGPDPLAQTLREALAMAMRAKGVELIERGQLTEGIAVLDGLLVRFLDDAQPDVQREITLA